MAKLIDNESGNISKSITLTSVADSYKLSFNCSNIGNGKSFIRIYATVSDTSYKTYFFPIQFLNDNEIEFSLDASAVLIQFAMIGNATVTGITLEEVTNATMEYVKANASYWDRIKEITSNTGKVRADMMEGIINMAVNAFANENGTVKQENGVYTFLNGTTVENSTMAVQIAGGGINVSDKKDSEGNWIFGTAITGAGINAATITSGILSAIEINGVTINSSSINSGTFSSCNMYGGKLYIGSNPPVNGDKSNFSGVEITNTGVINGYKHGNLTYRLQHSEEGRLTLYHEDKLIHLDSANGRMYTKNDKMQLISGLPYFDGDYLENNYIQLGEIGDDIEITANRGRGNIMLTGKVYINGKLIE